MNCVVGSSSTASPSQQTSRRLTVAAFVAGALMFGASASQAQNAAPAASQAKPAASSTTEPAAGTSTAAKKPAAAGAAGAKGTAAAGSASEKSQASYAIGVSVGSELRRSNINAEDISADRIAAGLRDAMAGKTQMSQEYQQTIMSFLRKAHEAQLASRAKDAEPNHAAAATFLAENGKKQGVVTTPSGLEYKVLTPGNGASPKPGDMVTVNYRGTLLNGTEFDASAKHGGPATFPSNGVIPGWQEALALMKTGEKVQLWIPPKLAYDLESPPNIPPGSMLIFDVELLSIKPGEAATPPGHPQIQPAQPAKPSSK
jgi:FKBP-type peptidyl-prolyl cis-trans isomerase FkpA